MPHLSPLRPKISQKNKASNEEDSMLLRQYLENNNELAFNKLITKHYVHVFHFIHSRVSNREDAADITGDVFLDFTKAVKRFQWKSSVKNFIYGIAKNKVYLYYDAQRRKNIFIQQSYLSVGDEDMFMELVGEEVDRTHRNLLLDFLIEQVFPQLSDIHRPAMEMFHVDKLTVDEIALILGIRKGAVKARLMKATTLCAKLVKDSGFLDTLLNSYERQGQET